MMMWNLFARLRLVAFGLGVLAGGSVVEASVISFKAVKKNDVAITPTNNLAVHGGDTIEVELFLSGWINDFPVDSIPNNVRAFEVKLNRAGYVSNDNGTAKPLGWCGPVDIIQCTQSATCPAEYPICLTSTYTGCTCSPHDPTLGAFITTSRTDFLLFGVDGPAPDVVTAHIDYKYFGIAENPAQAVPDTGVPHYLGTLILKVSANASGTFTIGFVREINSTFIVDPAPKPNVALPAMQPLLLTVSEATGACCNTLQAICTDDTVEGECTGAHRSWTQGASCADVPCDATPGACCDQDTFGGCTVTSYAECGCERCEWHKLLTCSEIECHHNPIPTTSEWGLVILTLLLLTGAKVYFGHQPGRAPAR